MYDQKKYIQKSKWTQVNNENNTMKCWEIWIYYNNGQLKVSSHLPWTLHFYSARLQEKYTSHFVKPCPKHHWFFSACSFVYQKKFVRVACLTGRKHSNLESHCFFGRSSKRMEDMKTKLLWHNLQSLLERVKGYKEEGVEKNLGRKLRHSTNYN